MIARGNLRHDPAEFFMCGNLRGDFAGKQFMRVITSSAQDRHSSLIARSFKCQYCFHTKQNTRVILSECEGPHKGRWITLGRWRDPQCLWEVPRSSQRPRD